MGLLPQRIAMWRGQRADGDVLCVLAGSLGFRMVPVKHRPWLCRGVLATSCGESRRMTSAACTHRTLFTRSVSDTGACDSHLTSQLFKLLVVSKSKPQSSSYLPKRNRLDAALQGCNVQRRAVPDETEQQRELLSREFATRRTTVSCSNSPQSGVPYHWLPKPHHRTHKAGASNTEPPSPSRPSPGLRV